MVVQLFVDSSTIRLRNVRSGRTTLHAYCRCPLNDNNSRFVHDFLHSHLSLSRTSLSSGSQISLLIVSSTIPRNVRVVDGLSTFDFDIGTRIWPQIDRVSWRAFVHSSVSGLPVIIQIMNC